MFEDKRWLVALFGCGAFFIVGLSSPAQGQLWPKKAYDATYEITARSGQTTHRLISDGQGHVRSESTDASGKVRAIMISDYPNRTALSLMPAQRICMKIPLRPASMQAVDEAALRQRHAQPLGVKIIDGHPCHGFRYSNDGFTTDTWVGDDIGTMVESSTSGGQIGQSTMRLKSFSSVTPNSSLFSVPSDYKIMQLPLGMPGGAGG